MSQSKHPKIKVYLRLKPKARTASPPGLDPQILPSGFSQEEYPLIPSKNAFHTRSKMKSASMKKKLRKFNQTLGSPLTEDPRNLQALLHPLTNANLTMVKSRKARMSMHRRRLGHLPEELGEWGLDGREAIDDQWPGQRRVAERDILRSGLSEKMLYNHNQTKTRFYQADSRNAGKRGIREGELETYDLLQRVDFQCRKNSTKRDKIRVVIPNKKKTAKDFLFEKIFDGVSTQENVYEHFENTLIENSINGVSGNLTADQQLHAHVRPNFFGENLHFVRGLRVGRNIWSGGQRLFSGRIGNSSGGK